MFKKTGFVLILSSIAVFSWAQIQWPAVTNTSRPWTRWWWEGNAVTDEGLTWNLQQYRDAGLGGVEITPIYGVHGYEKQFTNFLSTRWMQLFTHTLREAKRMNLGVDLANGTGWPFGGPWVSDKDASKSIYYKTFQLKQGEQLAEPVAYLRNGWVRTANNKTVDADSILQPLSANRDLQALALDQIQFSGNLPLISIMAYPENKSAALDLTSKADASGKLNWIAPPGNWTLYALFEGHHGKMVERAAPGGEGYAIDHFSSTAAQNYFRVFDTAFKGYDISYLRGFFNDSYEVDDARGQANWTTDFLKEFSKRKHYDLRHHLPALFGKYDSATNSRVIYDYRSVIDELLLEHFTMEWRKWGKSRNALLRNQSHGSPANTLDLYSVVDIPETEGTDILRFKFATSAANVTGKKLVSAESATWLNEHFLSSWADVKKAIDLYFLGGVNHIVYHGTAYSPKEAPWPGWLFYAAVHFQSTNPQWKDFHALNTYITRIQSFLQNGTPDNDILLYYPIIDRYSEPGNALLQHFDGMERNFEHTEFEHVAKWMVEKGYSFDFFSDRQLKNFSFTNNRILTGGNQYQLILLPANKLISEITFQKLVNLASQGATIVIYKALPGDVPGLAQLDARRKSLQRIVSQLNFTQQGNVKKATIGKGSFLMGDDLELLLASANARKETLAGKGLSTLRRKNKEGKMYFINNRTADAFNGWVELNEKPASIALFDPMTGQKGLARWKKNSRGMIEVFLKIQSFESIIIQTYSSPKRGSSFIYNRSIGDPVEIKGDWTITFLDGGPVIPQPKQTRKLGTWTELEGDDVKNFSGTAKYSIAFEKPAGSVAAWLLDLGKVNETAEVMLNGKPLATLIGPSYQAVIPATALQRTNKLEIIVANLMANRISYMDRNNIPWKIFYNTNMPARKKENVKNGLFDAAAWKPLPSGLTGPVTITPVTYQ